MCAVHSVKCIYLSYTTVSSSGWTVSVYTVQWAIDSFSGVGDDLSTFGTVKCVVCVCICIRAYSMYAL